MQDLIDRQTAIELVRDVCDAVMSGCESWYDPEIEDEVYKDTREVDAILKCKKEVRIALRNMPSAQPEIIRCKDCKHAKITADGKYMKYCSQWDVDDALYLDSGFFCGFAERRTDE